MFLVLCVYVAACLLFCGELCSGLILVWFVTWVSDADFVCFEFGAWFAGWFGLILGWVARVVLVVGTFCDVWVSYAFDTDHVGMAACGFEVVWRVDII